MHENLSWTHKHAEKLSIFFFLEGMTIEAILSSCICSGSWDAIVSHFMQKCEENNIFFWPCIGAMFFVIIVILMVKISFGSVSVAMLGMLSWKGIHILLCIQEVLLTLILKKREKRAELKLFFLSFFFSV